MPGRLMCVVAHPDDECFAFGGALALATAARFESSVLCLTDGQAATHRGNAADNQHLGQMRRDEFRRSCEKLGVTHHELLDYNDGTLDQCPLADIAHRLVERMRRFRPHLVLTFGLDGSLNVHADHTAVSCATSAAFHWAARSKRYPELNLPPWSAQRLYHQSTDFTLPDREPLLPAPWSVHLDIAPVRHLKAAAMREHTSQIPTLEKMGMLLHQHGASEFYTLAATTHPQPMQLQTDLFTGLDLS